VSSPCVQLGQLVRRFLPSTDRPPLPQRELGSPGRRLRPAAADRWIRSGGLRFHHLSAYHGSSIVGPSFLVRAGWCRSIGVGLIPIRLRRSSSSSELCSPCSGSAPFLSGGSRRPRSKLGAVDRHRLPRMSSITAPPVLVPDTHTTALNHVVLVRPSAVVRHSVSSTAEVSGSTMKRFVTSTRISSDDSLLRSVTCSPSLVLCLLGCTPPLPPLSGLVTGASGRLHPSHSWRSS